MEISFNKITRLEIISDKREWVKWNICVIPSVQDGGKTLKLFVENNPYPPIIGKSLEDEYEVQSPITK